MGIMCWCTRTQETTQVVIVASPEVPRNAPRTQSKGRATGDGSGADESKESELTPSWWECPSRKAGRESMPQPPLSALTTACSHNTATRMASKGLREASGGICEARSGME